MIRSLVHSLVRPIVLGTAIFAFVFAGTGCADVVVSSNHSRRAGLRHYASGEYVDAAGAFRNAVKIDPRDYKSHYYLGASYDATGSYQQAMQAYRSALDVMSVSIEGRSDKAFRARILDGLALSIAKGGERTFGETDAVAGAKVTQAEQKFIQAKVYRRLEDPDSALAHYKQAALLDSQNFHILREYGLYLEQLSQHHEATPVLRRAYALNSKDKDVNAALARLGTVTGPSLKERDDLIDPPVPQGPLPEVKWSQIGRIFKGGNPQPQQPADPAVAEQAGATLEPDVAMPLEDTTAPQD